MENLENIKKYSRELRTALENEVDLTQQDIDNLKKKYLLTENDIDNLEKLAEKSYEIAQNNYDLGNWDLALQNIEEAYYKSPYNKEILILYYKILTESLPFTNDKSIYTKSIEKIVKMLDQIDKKIVKQIKKNNSEKKNKKKYLLLLIVPILIFIFFIFTKKEPSHKIMELPEARILTYGNISVESDMREIPIKPDVEIVTSILTINDGNFTYNLQFLVRSSDFNIISFLGEVIWVDKNNRTIFSKEFIHSKNNEYFKSESVPINFSISSLRESPPLDHVIIKFKDLLYSDGEDRKNNIDVAIELPYGFEKSIDLKVYKFSTFKGIGTKYLDLIVGVKNLSKKNIELLNGKIVWFDSYNNIVSENKLSFLESDSVPIIYNDTRIINKTFEIEEIQNSKYKIIIEEIK